MSDSKFPFNVLLYLMLVVAIIGLIFLYGLKIDASLFYLMLTFTGIIFIGVPILVKKFGDIDFWFEVPINDTTEKSIIMLYLGILLVLVIAFISKISGLYFYNPLVSAPFVSFGNLIVGAESFNALKAVTSAFGTFFIVVFVAGVIEEIVMGWGAVMTGSLVVGYFTRKMLPIELGETSSKIWDFIGANIFAGGLFSLLHMLNSTYLNIDGTLNTNLFLFALSFRIFMNVLIYLFGNFGLMFSIGFHATNNALFLGFATVTSALLTFPGGFIVILILILTFIYFVWNFNEYIKNDGVIETFTKDFMTID